MARHSRVISGFVLAFFVASATAFGYSIERSEKLTILKFARDDFSEAHIEDDAGWRLGCLIETPSFDVPVSQDTEIEIVWDLYGKWEKNFQNAEALADYFLAVMELNYVDKFGHTQFAPKMLYPSHLGAVDLFFTTANGNMDMLGGGFEERKKITQGPMILAAGSKKIVVGLCDIAPDTSFLLHELQIRLRPLQ